MRLQVFISTTNCEVDLLYKKSFGDVSNKVMKFLKVYYVLQNANENSLINSTNYILIKSKSLGLSKSRNIALKYSLPNLPLLLSDDDVLFNDLYLNNIFNAIKSNIKYDILTFMYRSDIPKHYKYRNDKIHNILSISSISSIEVLYLKPNNLKAIKFNEKFGLGTNFPGGEENIFLKDCLNLGMRIKFVKKFICFHPGSTSNQSNITAKLIKTKYKVFCELYGFFLGVIITKFWLIKFFFNKWS